MPFWLIIAISLFWIVWFINEAHTFYVLGKHNRVTLAWWARASAILFIPFTIFWWSWIIWG